jgi:sigma-B regulation protein RsbU (phosphoserine phosphatase)
MSKKRKLRPFYRRLTRWIGLAQFIVMALASFLIYRIAEEVIKEEEFDLYEKSLKVTKKDVRRVLSDVYVGTINHVPDIEDNLDHPDKLYDIMQRMVELNPQIRSCALSFIADYYPQKGHWFCPYAVRDEDGNVVRKSVGGVNNDYLNAEWFTQALNAEEGYWSKPFFEFKDTVKPLVAYLVPIRNKQGKTVAILGADMSLYKFSGRLMKGLSLKGDTAHVSYRGIQEEDDGSATQNSNSFRTLKEQLGSFYFIIDHDGTYIAHPDSDYVIRKNYFELAKATNDTLDDYVGRQMVAREEGIFKDKEGDICHFDFFDFESSEVYMFYMPIEHTNWSIALAVGRYSIDALAIGFGFVFLILVGLALLVVRFVGRFVAKRVTRPLGLLAASANEVAKGNFNAPLPKLKHYDEVRLLRDSFEEMQHSLTDYIDELKETTASKAAIENELKVAHDIQMSMLPKTFPPYPERNDIDIFGSLTPAKDVGGDFFDFFIRDEKLFFCIGDVSGKGVPASLVMAMTRSLFRNVSLHVSEPDVIVKALNTAVCEGNEKSMFVTLFMGVLDLQTGMLHYSNAGHLLPLVIGQEVSRLQCDANLPIGVIAEWQYTQQTVQLDGKTTLFLYTDGLNEAKDSMQAQFGLQRIMRLAESLAAKDTLEPSVVVGEMKEAVNHFVDDAEQSDDLTLLAIRYK